MTQKEGVKENVKGKRWEGEMRSHITREDAETCMRPWCDSVAKPPCGAGNTNSPRPLCSLLKCLTRSSTSVLFVRFPLPSASPRGFRDLSSNVTSRHGIIINARCCVRHVSHGRTRMFRRAGEDPHRCRRELVVLRHL